jgi:hypothetical protein
MIGESTPPPAGAMLTPALARASRGISGGVPALASGAADAAGVAELGLATLSVRATASQRARC